MPFKKIAAITILTIIFSSSIYSQSEYFDKGCSGWGFSANYLSKERSNGHGFWTGFSINGRYDFGLSLSQIGNVQSYSFYTGVHLIKGDKDPLSLVAQPFISESEAGSWRRSSVTNYGIDLISYFKIKVSSLSAFNLSVGTGIYSFNGELQSNVFTGLSFYVDLDRSLKFAVNSTVSEDDETTGFGIGCAFMVNFNPIKKDEKDEQAKKDKKKRIKKGYYFKDDD